jgi:hypothetical protein
VELLDSRRLTGPNILSDHPAAVIDVRINAEDVAPFVAAWTDQVSRMLEAVGWARLELHSREMDGGVSVGFDAPIDALYAATDVNDWAFEAAQTVLSGEVEPVVQKDADKLRETIRNVECRRPA